MNIWIHEYIKYFRSTQVWWLFCRDSTDFDAERGFVYAKKIQNGSNRVAKTSNLEPKGNQKGAKVSQRTFENTTCGTGSKKWWNRGVPSRVFGEPFWIKINKNTIQKLSNKRSPQNIDFCSKEVPHLNRCQLSSNIDAKTCSKQNEEHYHFFLNGKIIQNHCKNKCSWRFSTLRARTEEVSNKNLKMIPKSIPKSMKNQCWFYARKSDAKMM